MQIRLSVLIVSFRHVCIVFLTGGKERKKRKKKEKEKEEEENKK